MVAWAKNGRNDSFTPSRASKSLFAAVRSRAILVTSTSTTVVSWAEVCRDWIIRAAIRARRRESFSVRPRAAAGSAVLGAAGVDAGAGTAGAASLGAGAAGAPTLLPERCGCRGGCRSRCGSCRSSAAGAAAGGGCRCGCRCGGRLLSRGAGGRRRGQDVGLADPATNAGAGDGGQVDAVFAGQLAHQRRDVRPGRLVLVGIGRSQNGLRNRILLCRPLLQWAAREPGRLRRGDLLLAAPSAAAAQERARARDPAAPLVRCGLSGSRLGRRVRRQLGRGLGRVVSGIRAGSAPLGSIRAATVGAASSAASPPASRRHRRRQRSPRVRRRCQPSRPRPP